MPSRHFRGKQAFNGFLASGFSSTKGSAMHALYSTPLRRVFLTSPEKGARTLVFLAEGTPGEDYPTGEYYERCKVARPNRQAADGALALGLWNRSVAILES